MEDHPAASRRTARRQAWWTWGLLVFLCVFALLVLLPRAEGLALAGPGGGAAWFLVPVFWLILAVPATLGVYGSCFRGHWVAPMDDHDESEPEAGPRNRCGPSTDGSTALRGMTSVWGVLTAGVLLSLGACVVAGAASPAIWPGVLMLMLLVLARPSVSPAFSE